MGLTRNLEAWEIVEQVRLIRRDLGATVGGGARVHGVLFQGMGEPLANADRVIQAIRVLSEPSAQAIDMRNITVCTAGLPSGIRRLAAEVPAVRLGLSLGSVRPGKRRQLMPIDGAHPLEEVLAAVGEHARATGHAPMWAYTLLADRNDTDEDAACLAALVRGFATQHGISPRLSLIPYNAIGAPDAPLPSPGGDERGASADPFVRSARLDAFRAVLSAAGVGSIVRYSGGGDVGAACGQLARRVRPMAGRARRLGQGERRYGSLLPRALACARVRLQLRRNHGARHRGHHRGRSPAIARDDANGRELGRQAPPHDHGPPDAERHRRSHPPGGARA
jgi:23S rRNA (adenine2503-C2)-methyltransferase